MAAHAQLPTLTGRCARPAPRYPPWPPCADPCCLPPTGVYVANSLLTQLKGWLLKTETSLPAHTCSCPGSGVGEPSRDSRGLGGGSDPALPGRRPGGARCVS